jgi:hypothetical protein
MQSKAAKYGAEVKQVTALDAQSAAELIFSRRSYGVLCESGKKMDANTTAHFDPTQDEIAILKQMELVSSLTLSAALRKHLSGRLYQHGYLARTPEGNLAITPRGRELVRRAEG